MPRWRLLSIVLAAMFGAACARTLPEQDRRITQARPVAKLSADLLWKDYESDRKAADARYWGRAVDVTGKVTAVESAAPARVVFELEPAKAIEARLLDDQAAAILGSTPVGERTTLRCFCAGLSPDRVLLMSCIKP